MARKSKRKAINWGPVLGVLLALNVALGLAFSPVTSIRRMRILGSQPHDKARLENLAKSLRGVPYLLVSTNTVESAVLAPRDVYSASLSHNLFGSAVLRVAYRQPVAALAGQPNIFMDDHGVLYGSPEAVPGLRQLALDPEYLQPAVALTLPWPSEVVADLCTKLNSFQELADGVVHVDTTGRLWISGDKTGKVDLGGPEQLDMKLRKLRQLLDDDPELLARVQSISLTDPTHPALEVRKGASS